MPRRCAPALLVLAALVLACAACAEAAGFLAGEVFTACCELACKATSDALCRDQDDAKEPANGDEKPDPTAAPPPPKWHPAIANCAVEQDAQGVRVDCPGGTRARFGADAVPPLHRAREPHGPTVPGPVELRTAVDVGWLAGTRAIEGSLIVASVELETLEAPELQSVGGDLVVSRALALQHLALPALAHVGGSVVIADNPKLPESEAEEIVFTLTHHGFAGAVDVAGNAPRAP